MESLITTDNIVFAIGTIGIIFTIYNYFRTPQEEIEKKQAVSDKELNSKATMLAQKEVENKAALLAQQVESEKCLNEKKFNEFNVRLDNAMSLAQNHIHSVDVKVDGLIATVGIMSNKVTELSTIINERIPKK